MKFLSQKKILQIKYSWGWYPVALFKKKLWLLCITFLIQSLKNLQVFFLTNQYSFKFRREQLRHSMSLYKFDKISQYVSQSTQCTKKKKDLEHSLSKETKELFLPISIFCMKKKKNQYLNKVAWYLAIVKNYFCAVIIPPTVSIKKNIFSGNQQC